MFRQHRPGGPVDGDFLVGRFTQLGLEHFQPRPGKPGVPFFEGPAVNHRLAPQALAHGPFQLTPQPQHPIHVIAVRDTHLVDLHEHVFEAGQPHVARVLIVVRPGSRHGTVVQKIGRLTTHAAQGALEMADSRLQGRQHRGRGHALGFVEMGDMDRRIRDRVENHGKIAVHLRRRGTAVVVGMLDIGGADLQPALGELHGVGQFRGPGNGAAPDGAHGSAHLQAGVTAFANGSFTLLPVGGQAQPGIGEMMLLFGGNHHQAAVRPDPFLGQGDGPVHGRFANGHGGDGDRIRIDPPFLAAPAKTVATQVGQDRLRIAELGHEIRVAQVGHLDVAAAGKNHLFSVEDLGPRGDEFLQVLKSVTHGDIAQDDVPGHARKNFPIIVFGHGAS
ncbi:hypothetical protein DESC_720339 [Desulfosarcina cetonica]|nr:hypothetical protein DESC_720339 [Desulfosarcina cetonica]